MSEATIRPPRPEDRPTLVRFMAALQDFERKIEPNRTPGPEMADGHLAGQEAWAAEHPGGGVLVAEAGGASTGGASAGGALAGFIIFGVKQEFGEYVPVATRRLGQISDLWVEPGARGRGIASALIAAAEARFRAAGLKRAEIGASAGNARAQRLYQDLGYDPCHVTLAKGL